jgi:hypothetical protein
MMSGVDADTLAEMQQVLSADRSDQAALGRLAAHLLRLRDALKFNDSAWFHALTQEIVTLDSASTYVPHTPDAEKQMQAAIIKAIERLLTLVGEKLISQVS